MALDLLGFGLSDKPADYGYSLFEQVDSVVEVARHRGAVALQARWIGALERCEVPVLVAWGARDPVAVLAIA